MEKYDALVVIDVQNDFCPGGTSPVPDGQYVIPVINQWIEQARAVGARVVASRDWHPPDHCSFREQGGPWPAHCIRETPGAAFAAELALPDDALVVSKGAAGDRDNDSAFDDTGLANMLHAQGIRRIWVSGLAEDVGVRASVLDACEAGFATHLVTSATRAINMQPGDGERAVEAMRAAGAHIELVA